MVASLFKSRSSIKFRERKVFLVLIDRSGTCGNYCSVRSIASSSSSFFLFFFFEFAYLVKSFTNGSCSRLFLFIYIIIDFPNCFCFLYFVRRAKMGQIFCCIKVDQSTLAIRESFGKFDNVLEPGCHCVPWICGKQIAGHLTLRVQQLDVRCETMTKVYCI